MNAQEIRAERAKHIAWFDEFKDKSALLENLLFMQYLAHLEIAAQFAELNARQHQTIPLRYICHICNLIRDTPEELRQHLDLEHHGGAR